MRPSPLFLIDAGQAWGLVFGIFVFIALMAGMYLLLKWLSGRGFAGASGRRMKALDRVMLTKDNAVVLVQIGLRIFAVGVGRDGVNLICEMKAGDFEEAAAPPAEVRAGFWRRFAHNMRINMRAAPEGTKPMGPGDSVPPREDSFAAVLARVAQREKEQEPEPNPIPGAQSAGESGRLRMEEELPRRAGDYQTRIDQMRRWGEPDALDRRSASVRPDDLRRAAPPPPPVQAETPHAAPEPAQPPSGDEAEAGGSGQGEKIDMLLDMIAKRQGRYHTDRKDGK